ncbi:MAG: GNAT family N-acetyltransferase [Roseovarius sp.]|uniref:GNAT family N-acetyltransferase n=1 Tax=Roseovarius sp. TaxID=1486281 RepID=UPI001B419900|nr:GNAT family N-acetyltransferase [Roseovarius sp.]MBQ0749085.1 GNAT family N-acetyltransferase [Roseovarius sp.]MBQ0809304.1 GNAT family N-acetyltransferase [Roseovarius sp.]
MTTFTVHIPEVKSGDLVLRAICEDDLDALAAFYAGARSHFVGGPLGRAECWRLIAANLGHWALRGYGMWVISDRGTGDPMGLCGFIFRDGWDEPELGWQVWDGHEGRGIAYRAAQAARAHGAANFGLDGVVSHIDPDNARSQALARRLGARFEREGTLLGLACQVWRHPKSDEVAA